MTNIHKIISPRERNALGINLKNLKGIIFPEWSAFSHPFCTLDIVDEKKPNGVKAKGVNCSPIKLISNRKIISAVIFPAVDAMLSSY
jgi:hypothetical protein